MLNRVTISTLLKTVIMTLGIAVIVMLSLTAWDSWRRLATAGQAEAAANAESYLFTALYNMRIDRATTVIRPEFRQDRRVADRSAGRAPAEMAALQSALEYLPQIDFPDQQALTAELGRPHQAHQGVARRDCRGAGATEGIAPSRARRTRRSRKPTRSSV